MIDEIKITFSITFFKGLYVGILFEKIMLYFMLYQKLQFMPQNTKNDSIFKAFFFK